MAAIIVAVFILGVIFGIAVRISVCDDLKDDRDYWEREAKKWCNQLSELRYKIKQQICDKCPDEDTGKCEECNK